MRVRPLGPPGRVTDAALVELVFDMGRDFAESPGTLSDRGGGEARSVELVTGASVLAICLQEDMIGD